MTSAMAGSESASVIVVGSFLQLRFGPSGRRRHRRLQERDRGDGRTDVLLADTSGCEKLAASNSSSAGKNAGLSANANPERALPTPQ